MPKIPRIKHIPLEVKHAVVFRNKVQVAAATGNANELGNHAIRMRNRMQDMTAYGEVEAAIRGREFEYALMLECQPGREMCVPRPG